MQRLDMTMYSVFCILSPWRKAPGTIHRMLSSQQQRGDIDGHGTPIIAAARRHRGPWDAHHSACVMVGLASAPDETVAHLWLGINE